MNQSYENFKKENRLRLFGHEDAGKENEDRLTSYYYKTVQYEDVMSSINLQIVTGEKGTGKSALLKMAYLECGQDSMEPVWIRLDDLSELYDDILKCDSLYQLKTLWKKSIGKLVVMKLISISKLDITFTEDYDKALRWAYSSGYASRDFISRTVNMLKPMYEKYIKIDTSEDGEGEHRALARMIKTKNIRLFFDDFDLDWKGNKSDILRIKSFLLSLSDMTSDIVGLSARVALRTDVYEMIRNEEFSDKFESCIIKCKWTNREILQALSKRICTYFDIPCHDDIINQSDITQQELSQYLNYVFESKFDESSKAWPNAPTHRVIYSLIRRKPRDMVKLCQSTAEEAYNQHLDKINAMCFINILENYSQERMRDLINEYSKQLPKLEDLLVRMAPNKKEIKNKSKEKYVYTTAQLYEKIKEIQQNIPISIFHASYENLQTADFHQIAHFLYKIGFITGRKRGLSGKISRVNYDEAPYLLKANTGDGGYSWEIHPAYRGALAKGINDTWETTVDISHEE